jgi:phosphoserine phosphatase RsbU/P
VFLIPICAVAAFFQIVYTIYAIQNTLAGTQTVSDVFVMNDERVIQHTSAQAEKAGLKVKDYIVRLGGREPTGNRVYAEELNKRRPGQALPLEVLRPGESQARHIEIPLTPMRDQPPGFSGWLVIGLLLLAPLAIMAAGIIVVLLRPFDRRAIIVFGLLITISQFIHVIGPRQMPEWMWAFAVGFMPAVASLWPAWMLLFGIYFPERSDWDRRRPWLKWLLLGPILLIPLFALLGDVSLDHYRIASPVEHLLTVSHANVILFVFTFLGVTVFFFSLSFKAATSQNADSKRRLRLLVWGTAASLTPLLGCVIYGYIKGNPFDREPEWVIITACLIFFLFPITLVYVVLAERAMNIRMVLRQGARYALARNSARIALVIVAAGLISLINNLVVSHRIDLGGRLGPVVITALVVVITVRVARKRLFDWVDRKFFRDTYNSEQILEELSESVRSMVDERVLLDTVSRCISDSLHVPNVAVLLNGSGTFRPVYCLGLELPERLGLPESATTVNVVKSAKEPPRVYFDDENNWVYDVPPGEAETLRTLNSQLLLPVGLKNRLLGILSLGPKKSEEPYSRSDVQLLRSVAVQTGLALENSRLTQTVALEIAQREKLNREIEIAREVQERLFPQQLVPVPGIDYRGACRPAQGVGGDYYDFIPLPNGDLGIAIGDVSGKGIAAALLMASLQASLRGQTIAYGSDLASLMRNVNGLVFDTTPPNRYATFFYGQYNRESGIFTYVNAGHNPPVLLRRNSDETHIIRLETGGPVIGLFRNSPYQQATIALQEGDMLVGFTDGISEAMNNEEEEWGEERLIPALANCLDKPAAEIIPEIMAEADHFVAGAAQHDDMTIVVVKLVNQPMVKNGMLP